MKLLDRIKAESSDFGKLLKTWVAGFFTLCSAIGALVEYANMLPPNIVIPMWIKYVIYGAAGISFAYGHWTVKQNKSEQV